MQGRRSLARRMYILASQLHPVRWAGPRSLAGKAVHSRKLFAHGPWAGPEVASVYQGEYQGLFDFDRVGRQSSGHFQKGEFSRIRFRLVILLCVCCSVFSHEIVVVGKFRDLSTGLAFPGGFHYSGFRYCVDVYD